MTHEMTSAIISDYMHWHNHYTSEHLAKFRHPSVNTSLAIGSALHPTELRNILTRFERLCVPMSVVEEVVDRLFQHDPEALQLWLERLFETDGQTLRFAAIARKKVRNE